MAEALRIPIIRLHGNLIVSLQGTLSDRLVAQLKEDVTERILVTKARGLIIDVSGIDIMDSYITRNLRDIGLISRMMGVTTAISGLDPMIAMTLVEMGLSLQGVRTEMNLEDALRYLKSEQEVRGRGARKISRRSQRRRVRRNLRSPPSYLSGRRGK